MIKTVPKDKPLLYITQSTNKIYSKIFENKLINNRMNDLNVSILDFNNIRYGNRKNA